jgi:phenylacetate-CoA ligase
MTESDSNERMEREDLEQIQVERLQATLNRACQNVAFYRDKYESLGIDIRGIKSLADLALLPFTTKDDLRENYPYGMFAVPLKDIVRIHTTSGTMGKSVVVGYTAGDIAIWARSCSVTPAPRTISPRSPSTSPCPRRGWGCSTAPRR